MIQPFTPILFAVREIVRTAFDLPEDTELIGKGLAYDGATDYYVWLDQIPGGSNADAIEGSWAVDIDIFGKDYGEASQKALDLEAHLLSPGGHRTPTMRVDSVVENTGPHEGFWDDDTIYRISATYVFTARRPSRP